MVFKILRQKTVISCNILRCEQHRPASCVVTGRAKAIRHRTSRKHAWQIHQTSTSAFDKQTKTHLISSCCERRTTQMKQKIVSSL